MKTNSNLSQDRIERLEEIGFQWQVLTDYDKILVHSKRSLDTAMFRKGLQAIHHWDTGVAT